MGAFDTRSWNYEHSEYSDAAVGDTGHWISWLPLAWRSVADPAGSHAPPKPPPPGHHGYMTAWWGPLPQLLFFGLGWIRPDLGLVRWIDIGQPTEDPVLRTVKRWWGPQLLDYLAMVVPNGQLVQ